MNLGHILSLFHQLSRNVTQPGSKSGSYSTKTCLPLHSWQGKCPPCHGVLLPASFGPLPCECKQCHLSAMSAPWKVKWQYHQIYTADAFTKSNNVFCFLKSLIAVGWRDIEAAEWGPLSKTAKNRTFVTDTTASFLTEQKLSNSVPGNPLQGTFECVLGHLLHTPQKYVWTDLKGPANASPEQSQFPTPCFKILYNTHGKVEEKLCICRGSLLANQHRERFLRTSVDLRSNAQVLFRGITAHFVYCIAQDFDNSSAHLNVRLRHV